ncbi:family 20 glycosylhydrolase [Bacteroidales bacterium OttesenSCG-928-M11]|nr:family 20 glycosylhydrolase [Bacteroidales bacterium OttesenSCG-928-M11]
MNRLIFRLLTILLLSSICTNILANDSKPALIPYPTSVEWTEGSYSLSNKTRIILTDRSLEEEIKFIKEVILQESGLSLPITSKNKEQSIITILTGGETDSYSLIVNPKNITIEASTKRSILLATQTLRQLIVHKDGEIIIPSVIINDKPEWEWRGMHLDVSRHFYDKNEVMRFLDLIARYKFNKFHWHLTDDQGWRVEIKKYPELTEVSAWREYNKHDLTLLRMAEKEHNTNYLLPEKRLREVNGTKQYGGYYTQEEIQEVVNYATSLGIDVLPEIDMPGHMSGAIASYPELSCFNSTGWGKVFSSPLCPGKDKTLDFCKDILREIFDLFPFEYIHLGADEVEKINWEKCPHCQERIIQEGLANEKELQSWFVKEMENFFIENDRKMVAWDEVTEGSISKTTTMMWWRPWARTALPIAFENGNKVILAPNSTNYFDFKQHANTLQDLYEANLIPSYVDSTKTDLILGVQANIWCEYIPSMEQVEYMAFPRILAFSETAWRKEERKEWNDFYQRMINHFPSLDKLGVNYRPLDLPGVFGVNAFVDNTEIVWNHPLKGIELRYTTDGTIPNNQSSLYTKPIEIDTTTHFMIRMFRPNGSAADIINTIYKKEKYRIGVYPEVSSPGLRCDWHEGIFNRVAEIEQSPIKETYKVEGITIPQGVNGKRGLIYTGYINIPKDEIYTFSLGSDDGSVLYINGETIIDNDGPHSPITIEGQVALAKGFHPIKLAYFDMNNGGFVKLQVFDCKGNEIEAQYITRP